MRLEITIDIPSIPGTVASPIQPPSIYLESIQKSSKMNGINNIPTYSQNYNHRKRMIPAIPDWVLAMIIILQFAAICTVIGIYG